MMTFDTLVKLAKRPTYIKILSILCKEPATVTKLVRETGSKRSRIKQYLRDLVGEGLVKEVHIGNLRVYVLTDKARVFCQ